MKPKASSSIVDANNSVIVSDKLKRGLTMFDETDMTEGKAWLVEKWVTKAVESFRKRRINAQYVKHREEALSAILEMIPGGNCGRG